jgi:uncharacterized membrane protein
MKNINYQAPVKCSKSIVINANKEKIWVILTDIDNWPTWNKDVSFAKLYGNLQPNSDFRWKAKGIKIYSKLETVEAYQYFSWTGTSFGLNAIHNWCIQENSHSTGSDQQKSCTVFVEESLEGLLATLFKNSFNKSLASDMQASLEFLKDACEKE